MNSLLLWTVLAPSVAARHLALPKGTSLVITIAVSTFFPEELPDGFAHVVEYDHGFPLPERIFINRKQRPVRLPKPKPTKRKPVFLSRKKREKLGEGLEREALLELLQEYLLRFGVDGPACLERLECELRQAQSPTSLLVELLMVVFVAERPQQVLTCCAFACPFSPLQIILNSQHIL